MRFRKTSLLASLALLIICLIVITGRSAGIFTVKKPTLIPYEKWPQMHIGGIRILIASEPKYAHQGFAGAVEKDFEKTIIVFPGIIAGTIFTNVDQGYGPVLKDLKIIFLDANMNPLKEDILIKKTGSSTAPPGTAFVIEGLLPQECR